MTAASSTVRRPRPKHSRLAWLVLLLLVAALLAMVVTPVYLIMPFKSQTPRALDLSFQLKRWSPMATAVGLGAAIALTIYLWRGGRWFKRTVLVLFVALLALLAWFARQNHFEWRFHPLPAATFAGVGDAAFVGDSDQVMTVALNDEAVAYPIRQMAYHHVVEDTVGGVPIAATY